MDGGPFFRLYPGRMTTLAPHPPLSDGVVTLRPPDERDLAAIDRGIHDPDVVRWFGQPTASAADVLEQNRGRWADGSGPTFSICEADGACVGHVWVNRKDGEGHSATVGYWLLPGARGRGLATRAVRLLSAWAVRDLGITRLRAIIEPANERSIRVAERSGFLWQGLVPDHDAIEGLRADHVEFLLPAPARLTLSARRQ